MTRVSTDNGKALEEKERLPDVVELVTSTNRMGNENDQARNSDTTEQHWKVETAHTLARENGQW